MTASLLLTNARVLDPTPLPPGDDSVGVVDGRIVAVGPRHEVADRLPAEHAVRDLTGRTVVPGFIDAHLHPLPLCFYEHHVDLSTASDLDEVADMLSERSAVTDTDGWVVGLQLDEEALAERRLPSRSDLDRLGAGKPTVIIRRDGHHAVGSTAALTAAGIHPDTADPPGGVIHREADGSLSGLCAEAAAGLLLGAVPIPTWQQLCAALDAAVAKLAGHGVTGISAMCQSSDVGPAGAAGELEAMAWSMLVERVPFDIQTILIAASPATVSELQGGPLHRPAERRRLDAVKLFLDGTLGGRTACLHQPYHDASTEGLVTLSPDDAYPQMVAAHTGGLQICLHAIGDRANRTAVDLYDRLLREHPAADCRHRIEHASVLDGETPEMMRSLGVAAVVQPASIESERRWLAHRLGPDRFDSVYPYRELLDAGVRVAGSSDAPIETYDVLRAMRAAVSRWGVAPGQAITPTEALAMYTTEAAHVRHVDGESGRLVPGARADLVVLSHDLTSGLDAEVEVLSTTVGGVEIHHDPRLGQPW